MEEAKHLPSYFKGKTSGDVTLADIDPSEYLVQIAIPYPYPLNMRQLFEQAFEKQHFSPARTAAIVLQIVSGRFRCAAVFTLTRPSASARNLTVFLDDLFKEPEDYMPVIEMLCEIADTHKWTPERKMRWNILAEPPVPIWVDDIRELDKEFADEGYKRDNYVRLTAYTVVYKNIIANLGTFTLDVKNFALTCEAAEKSIREPLALNGISINLINQITDRSRQGPKLRSMSQLLSLRTGRS